jgi:HEAT repeat protein
VAPRADDDRAHPGDGASDLDALIRTLADGGPEARDRAARDLGDRRDARAIPALTVAMESGRGGRGVVWALTQFDDPATAAPLAAALSEPDATARAMAAGRLADLGGRGAVPALLAALADDDDHVREEVARALGRVGDPVALDPLLAALGDDPGPHVREEAATAVGALAAAQDAAAALEGAAPDPDARVADAPAAEAPMAEAPVAEARGRDAAFAVVEAALVDALADRHVAVRRAAAEALARMGPATQARLRALAAGPRSRGRDAAAAALAALEAGRLMPAGPAPRVPKR